MFQQHLRLHQIFTIMVIMKLLVASRPPRIYNLIAEDKSIDYSPYDSAIGPYQRCVSMCTLDSECFSFDFTPQSTTPYGECRLYDTTYSIYTNQSRVLTTQTGTRYYSTFPKDCADLYTLGLRQSGVYQVHLLGKFQRNVYCLMDRYDGGWMAFQRRFDGSVEFKSRGWSDFKNGFGDPYGEYYLGNEMLHLLTTAEDHDYRVMATTFTTNERNSKLIRNVVITDEADKYRIRFELSSIESNGIGYGERMQNYQFSTHDQDNDVNAGGNCAQAYGAWWHEDCHNDNMNGEYKDKLNYQKATASISWVNDGEGIIWRHWKNLGESLKTSMLMIRPSNFKA